MTMNFTVNYRNPGHWDIYDCERRLYCIRGNPGHVVIQDERVHPNDLDHIRRGFTTVEAAMAFICSTLMYEEK